MKGAKHMNVFNLIKYITLSCCLWFTVAGTPQKMVVTVPFADLRTAPTSMPTNLHAPAFSRDVVAQNSQVLFGEKLITNETESSNTTATPSWVNCCALEQEIVTTNKTWQGCPGYLQKDQVTTVTNFPHGNVVLQDLWTPVYPIKNATTPALFSLAAGTILTAQRESDSWWRIALGDKEIGFILPSATLYELSPLVKESPEQLRTAIVTQAKKFLGTPYVWGGRTPHGTASATTSSYLTGIDCSDFTNLVFRMVGLQIPKNSTSQFYGLPAIIKHGKDLQPGDLIFFTRKDDLQTMCHVMLYIGRDKQGNGLIIESTGKGVSSQQEAINRGLQLSDLGVGITKLIDYLGVDVDQLEAGKTIHPQRGYFVLMGSYISSQEITQGLRSKLLN